MNESVPAGPSLTFAVHDSTTQEVMITVKGPDVLEFESNRQQRPKDRERPLRDPVAVVVDAARLGMFAGPTAPPWDSGAELRTKEVDLVEKRQTWRVAWRNIDPGVFRVLVNILRSRHLENIEINTISRDAAIPRSYIDLLKLPYPVPRASAPFILDYEMPDRTGRNRYLQICFAREPDDAETEAVFDALDKWTWLLMLGGYPGENMDPSQSGAAPDPAFLVDSRTVEQAFPDLFLCDDDCYAAVINYAQALHRSVCPIEILLIR